MDLDALMEKVGDATAIPEDPPNGIPRQKLSPMIRWSVRALLLPFIWLDLFTQKLAKWMIPPPYKMAGACLKRGNCCHYILLKEIKGIAGKLVWIWHTEFNGFFLRDRFFQTETNKNMLVLGCRYLKKNGACGHHFFRPMICRKWPIIEHFGKPHLVKGCGYKAYLKSELPKAETKDKLSILK